MNTQKGVIIVNNQLLRYKISDWHQLVDVKSNNSRDLRIYVSDIMQDERLSGVKIDVYHPMFEELFTYIINPSGSMVTPTENCEYIGLSTDDILSELAKFGFLVKYDPESKLSGDELDFLMSINKLGYQKLRKISVHHEEYDETVFEHYIVAFNIKENPRWLDMSYSPSDVEFSKSLINGSATNISAIVGSKHWSWEWLDFVADIDDVLEENM